MKIIAIAVSLGLLTASVFADDKIAEVQELLKNGGYYFGEVTGEKNADTTAAIRRYQIRNGLDINGELTDDTYKSIRANANSSPPPAVAASRPAATPPVNGDRSIEDEQTAAPPNQTYQPPRQDRQSDDVVSGEPVQPGQPGQPMQPGLSMHSGYFAGTPYGNAPPEVQQDVIVRAQKRLAKREMYRGPINGVISSDLEFSLRAYQSRIGLQPTGRLDLQTLAALELLPGADQPVFVPRRPYRVRPGMEPPVRGEWIRP